jgi:hypothetical protein
MNGHNDPRYLKWGAGRVPWEASIRRVSLAVKRVGEKSELSTTVNRCTMNGKNSQPDCECDMVDFL